MRRLIKRKFTRPSRFNRLRFRKRTKSTRRRRSIRGARSKRQITMVLRARSADYIGYGSSAGDAVPVVVSESQNLDDIQGAGDFAFVFRYYRIRKVIYEFRPWYAHRAVNLATDASFGAESDFAYNNAYFLVSRVNDSQDSALYTDDLKGVNRLLNTTSVLKRSRYPSFKFQYSPKVETLSETGSTSAQAPRRSPWISTSDLTLPHWGIAYCWDSSQIAGQAIPDTFAAPRWTVYKTYIVDFKMPFIQESA